jgi:hypothetical protein
VERITGQISEQELEEHWDAWVEYCERHPEAGHWPPFPNVTMEELRQLDPDGPDDCRSLASRTLDN